MKIGVITFWNSNDNYGQILQCWALQQKLIKLGHEPFIIKFLLKDEVKKSSIYQKIVKIIRIYPIITTIKNRYKTAKINHKKHINEQLNKERCFSSFRNNNIIFSSETYASLNELINNPPKADIYITGSDQVWGFKLDNINVSAYFLNFGGKEIIKFSYAASFGMNEYYKDMKSQLKTYLSNLHSISVREKTGVNICKELGLKAKQVLDPSLLLDVNDYNELISDCDNVDCDYIFIYSLNIINEEQINWKELKKFALDNNYKIIVTPSSGYYQYDTLFKDVEYVYPTIEKWISLIKNAKLVVTPSFHGIVYSILYHKPFVYAPVRGYWSRGNNRIYDFLELIDVKPNLPSDGYKKSIFYSYDWDEIDKKIAIYKKDSIDYLLNNMKK